MYIDTVIRLAKKFADMGTTVQDQAVACLTGDESMDEQNDNALEMIADWLDECDKRGVDGAEDYAADIRTHLNRFEGAHQ